MTGGVAQVANSNKEKANLARLFLGYQTKLFDLSYPRVLECRGYIALGLNDLSNG